MTIKKLLFLAAIVVAAWFAYQRFMPQGGWGGAPPGAPPVSVAEVIEKNVRQWHEFSGRLVAVDQAQVRPRISGAIESIHFKDGDLVKKGELLFIIDPRPYEAAEQAASARASQAEAALTRANALMNERALSQRDYDQRKSDAEVARADLTRAKLDLEYTHIRSPITGRAGRAEITAGNLVESGSGAPVLTTVVSITPIYADFDIDEATYAQYVQAGVIGNRESDTPMPVMMGLSGESGAPHEGHVVSFDNKLDTASGTLRVRAVFDNTDGALVPGLFARIMLGSPAETPTLLITDRAVGTDQNKKFVTVVKPDNATEKREIKIDGLVDGLRVVSEGLQAGEKIIVNGTQRVMMPGQKVTPELVPMEQGPETGNQKPETGSQKSEEENQNQAPEEKP